MTDDLRLFAKRFLFCGYLIFRVVPSYFKIETLLLKWVAELLSQSKGEK